MSHNAYARRLGIWSNYSVPNANDLAHWDAAQYAGLDGDNGGQWYPVTPIVIGGAGVQLSGVGNGLAGGVTTSSGGRIQHGNSDYVQLTTPFTRTEIVSLYDVATNRSTYGIGGLQADSVVLSRSPYGVSPIPAFSVGDFWLPIPSRYLHQGASVVSAALTCRALVRQQTAPATPPYWMLASIVAMSPYGATVQKWPPSLAAWQSAHAYAVNSVVIPNNNSLSQTGFFYVATAVAGTGTSGATPPAWPTFIGGNILDNAGPNQIQWQCQGYGGVLPDPNSGGGNTYGGGAVQTITMSPATSLPLTIDCSSYDYYLRVIYDSFGAGTVSAPNWLFHALSLSYGGIVDMRPE